jgi:hypothetical protein
MVESQAFMSTKEPYQHLNRVTRFSETREKRLWRCCGKKRREMPLLLYHMRNPRYLIAEEFLRCSYPEFFQIY